MSEVRELIDSQLLCAEVKYRVLQHLGSEKRTNRITQGLSPLIESCFHQSEKIRCAAVGHLILTPAKADDGTFHLGRRLKTTFIHFKQIGGLIERLNQHTQYSVGFTSGSSNHALSNFFLEHTYYQRNLLFPFQDPEKDLG